MTRRLPRSLSSWEPELIGLSHELVLSLRDAITRLAALVGPAQTPITTELGEPDGFDGIHRRGTPERLLMTEWAIAEEVPMEFLRRAVDGEQSYLRLHQVSRTVGRRCVVLLDAPPSQHGAPRLAHLAMLIVLAGRARRAGADFGWSYLCDSTLRTGLAESDLRHWRKTPRWTPADGFSIERWVEQLGSLEEDDLWFVGGPELVAPVPCSRVVVTEPLDRTPHLRVEVHRQQRGERWVRLDLPPSDAVVELFRRPSSTSQPRTAIECVRRPGMAGETRMWFSQCGTRLLLLRTDGVWAEHVPNSLSMALKHGAAKPLRWIGHVLAAGARGGTLIGMVLEDERVVARGLTDGGATPDLEHCAPVEVHGSEIVVLDDHGELWDLPSGRKVATQVLAMGEFGYVRRDGDAVVLRTWKHRNKGGRVAPMPVDGELRACFVHGRHIAIQVDGRFRIGGDERAFDVVGQPVGVLVETDPGVVSIDGDRILHTTAGGEQVLVVADRPIASAACSPNRPMVAWRSDDGHICVYDVRSRANVVEVVPL